MNPSISIIINNYNYGRYLRQCINSALDQTVKADEVIVVDDGSTDESRAVLQEYGDRVRVLLKENGGQASAMNAGFAVCSGNWVWFLDADDWLVRDAVEQFIAVVDDRFIRVHFRLAVMDGEGRRRGWMPKKAGGHCIYRPKNLLRVGLKPPFTPTSGNVFHRAALERVMPIPEGEFRLCADEYLMYAGIEEQAVSYNPSEIGYYRSHGRNAFLQHSLFNCDERFLRQRLESMKRTHRLILRAFVEEPDFRFAFNTQQLRTLLLVRRVLGEKSIPNIAPTSISELTKAYQRCLERTRSIAQIIKEWVGFIIVRYLPLRLVRLSGWLEARCRMIAASLRNG